MNTEYRENDPPEELTNECRYCGNPLPYNKSYCNDDCYKCDTL